MLTAGKRTLADDDRVHELHGDVAGVGGLLRCHAPQGGPGGEAASQGQASWRQVLGRSGSPQRVPGGVHARHRAPVLAAAAAR